MSFVMFAAGPTSSSRIRTLRLRALLGLGAVTATVLLAAGTGLGFWLSQQVSLPAASSASPATSSFAPPFAVEQLGALSGAAVQAGKPSRPAQPAHRVAAR